MEPTLSKEVKVGIFAGLGVLAFVVSILLLGGNKMVFRSTYRLRVQLEDVQGLAHGSVISLEGVPVGNVHSLEFIPQSKMIEVSMDIDSEFRNRITAGSRASVKTQGALGDKYIFIEAGPLSAPALETNSLLEKGGEDDLLDVITKKGAEFAEIADVIKEARELLYEINANGRSREFMENLVASSKSLRQILSETEQSMSPTKDGSLKHLQSILKKLDDGKGTLGALINDPTIHNKLLQILGGSKRNQFLTPMLRESIKETGH